MIQKERVEVDKTLLIFAFRYALGRMTYAPGMVADALREHKSQLSWQQKKQIIEEINLAIRNTPVVMECDKVTWQQLVRDLME